MSEEKNAAIGVSNKSKSLLYISGATFLLAFAILLLTASYLVYTNPEINYLERERKQNIEKKLAEERGSKLKQWKYDEFSDVDVRSEEYPIVVLRTGFKVIRIDSETSLVGWKYEMINTSPKTKYTININYKLEDDDGFEIGESRGTTLIQPNGYGVATGTLTIPNSDLDRLSGSGWLISLSPDWEQNEKATKGKRYERLVGILKKDAPYWVKETAEKNIYVVLSEKWAEINNAIIQKEEIEPEEPANIDQDHKASNNKPQPTLNFPR